MGKTGGILLTCLFWVLVGTPRTADAEEARLTARSGPSFAVGVEGQTSFPMLVGGNIWAELPGRLRLSTSLGTMPGAYSRVVGSVVQAAGSGSEMNSDLVNSALQKPLFWGASLGWRPFARHGAYLQVGYALAFLSSVGDTRELAAQVIGKQLPTSLAVPQTYTLDSRLHMVTAEVGWFVRVWKGVTLRAALGGMFTVGSSTSILVSSTKAVHPKVSEVITGGEQMLDDAYTSYVFTPTISLALGWQVWPF